MMTTRTFFAAIMLVILAGGAAAQGNGMGVFFSETDFTDATTNASAGAEPLDLYIVVLDCAYASVGQYECSISFDGVAPTVLGADGPAGSGWANFGSSDVNHLVQFSSPPLTVGGAAVLGIVTIAATEPSLVEILLGASTPATVSGQPMVANGSDLDDFTGCGLTSGVEIPGTVATINGGGIAATESANWSAIRELFD